MANRLLLADDSITIQKVVELVLNEEDFEIKTASNGEEALAAIDSFNPDVVLADIIMPRMNGYQLCEKIKSNPDTKHIPVILLAGAFEPLDEELAKNVGAEDHIVKPFESQELISKINAAIATMEMFGKASGEERAAEAVEVIGPEDDLWSIEEIVSEPAGAEEIAEGIIEETPAEGIGAEEPFMAAETEEITAGLITEKVVEEEGVTEEITPKVEIKAPSIELPSKEEFADMFRRAVDEKITEALSSADIKESLISSLAPLLKDSAEKILWEVVPQLAERLLREELQGAFASITKEVEKVIWETVPDLAETIISREIEKIKSEI